MVVKAVFLEAGRVLMNNNLSIGIGLEYGVFYFVSIFMGNRERQTAVQFKVKFKHIDAAEVSGAEIMQRGMIGLSR